MLFFDVTEENQLEYHTQPIECHAIFWKLEREWKDSTTTIAAAFPLVCVCVCAYHFGIHASSSGSLFLIQ